MYQLIKFSISSWRALLLTGAAALVALMPQQAQAVVIADSQLEFSGVQGQDNWQYGYGLGGTFAQSPTYNAGGTMFGFGTAGVWEGVGNVRHVREGSHPNSAGGSHEGIRRWTSEVTGWVKVTGTLSKFDLAGDGVTGAIRINGNGLTEAGQPFTQVLRGNDGIGVNYTKYIQVDTGDTVDFLVHFNGNNSNDATRYTATISTVGATTQIYDAARDFSVLPANNTATSTWQYVSIDGLTRDGSYTLLQNNTTPTGLSGLAPAANTYPVVSKNASMSSATPFGTTLVSGNALTLHPSPTNGAGIGWLAPDDGFVDIDGFLKRLDNGTGGDGIQWFLDLNTTELDSGTLANVLNQMDSFSLSNVAVSAGDMLWLGVLPGANHSNDLTQLSWQIAFTPVPELASLLLWCGALGIALALARRWRRAG